MESVDLEVVATIAHLKKKVTLRSEKFSQRNRKILRSKNKNPSKKLNRKMRRSPKPWKEELITTRSKISLRTRDQSQVKNIGSKSCSKNYSKKVAIFCHG